MLAFFRGKWYIIDANWGMHSRMHPWESRETGSLFVVCAPRARSNGWRRQSLRHLVSVHNEISHALAHDTRYESERFYRKALPLSIINM